MPKIPARNVNNYKIDGGQLNEYEFQQNQQKLAEAEEFPFGHKQSRPSVPEAGNADALRLGNDKAPATKKAVPARKSGASQKASASTAKTGCANKAAKKAGSKRQ